MKDHGAQDTAARLRQVLARDRMQAGTEMMAMLRSDMRHLLGDYFDLDADSVMVHLEPKEDGSYQVHIVAKAIRIVR